MIFRNWVLQNFPFLEDDFDALTDYELFCKMLEYVKGFTKDNEEFKKQLADFENYFNNLDVQEEINNKLDEMSQDGSLENIISQYIELMTTYTYNNVADMKSATNLVNGSFARTSGFYSYNDGGGSFYKIRTVTNEDVVDESNIIALNNNTLVAELVKEKTMSPKQFGAYGDNIHDDTLAIQTCFDNCKNIIFDSGTYLINTITHVLPKSNSIINLSNAILKAIPNEIGEYSVIRIENVQNIKINNGTIQGDRDDHTGTSGEWGHCIWIQNSNNIEINHTNLIDAWGDGLYLYSGTNIKTSNLYINNTRRNGISVISVNGYKSINDYIENINGTAPQTAIDFEPNNANDTIKNAIVENMTIKNCVGDGIAIALSRIGTNETCNISLNNIFIENCYRGIYGGYIQGIKGQLIIDNLYCYNLKNSGIAFNTPYTEGFNTIINKPYIKNFNTNNTANVGAIQSGASNLDWGNITINLPYLETTDELKNNSYGLLIGGYDGHHPKNVVINTPLNNQLPINCSYGENIKINDTLNLYTKNTFDTNGLIQNNGDINTTYTNLDKTEGATVGLRPYTPTGLHTRLLKLNDLRFTIKIPNGQYVKSLSANAGINISLVNVGDSITLEKINATEWIVVNVIGTPTIS